MPKETGALLEELLKTNELDTYITAEKKEFVTKSPADILNALFAERSAKKGDIIWDTGISPSFIHQIFAGKRTPSRDKFIAICIAMSVPLEKLQASLKAAGMLPLYAKSERDSVIIFGINQNLNCTDINNLLYRENLKLLKEIK